MYMNLVRAIAATIVRIYTYFDGSHFVAIYSTSII